LLPAVDAAIDIVARSEGVLAGCDCARETFRQVDPAISAVWFADDGSVLVPGTVIAAVSGPIPSLLTAERTVLNFLGHLSGVASATARFVHAVSGSGHAVIVETRKTTPGLRVLEKAAVRAGGGHNHRLNLSDAVMFKDNHLALLPIADAVAAARARWPALPVEVECDRLDQVVEALACHPDVIMLDNMSPAQVAECMTTVAQADPDHGVLIEVSGRVDTERAAAYAAAGVDVISVGGLTHSAPSLDIAFDFKER
jgi:nicotinate-nucleotide pyrophosphorylase (carboxylating)